MLFIVGTILRPPRLHWKKTLILHMVRLFVLTALLVMLPQWGNEAQRILQTSILDGLGVDRPRFRSNTTICSKCGVMPVMTAHGGTFSATQRVHRRVVDLRNLWLVGYFAALLLFWAYIIQKFILSAPTPSRHCSSASWRSVRCGPSALATSCTSLACCSGPRLGRRRAHHSRDFGLHD